MVLSTEWSQVEVIDLYNDGNGLGFILVGGRSTGVVIKSLTPGGVAERDARLQCGDHLLQIGDVNLRGFSSEQVATVLRQTGAQVRLIVARPIEPAAVDIHNFASHAPIIPTKLLSDPDELSRHLYENPSFVTSATSNLGGCLLQTPDTELADLPLPPIPSQVGADGFSMYPKDLDIVPFSIVSPPPTLPHSAGTPLPEIGRHIHEMDYTESVIIGGYQETTQTINNENDGQCFANVSCSYPDSPETETYVVKLRKNVYGLGITVAGYVCEEEDLSGIFVKSIIEGSAAEMSGQIQINDRIVAVDGKTFAGVTNHQAVEMLRNTDIEVGLTLERFLRGRKFEHLQVALTELKADSQSQTSLPASPSIATLTWLPQKSDADSTITDGGVITVDVNDFPSRATVDSNLSNLFNRSEHSIQNGICNNTEIGQETTATFETVQSGRLVNGSTEEINGNGVDSGNDTDDGTIELPPPPPVPHPDQVKPNTNSRTPTSEMVADTVTMAQITASAVCKTSTQKPSMDTLRVAWKSEFPESEIIVAEINKLSGLGISLEGTVDVEGGIEKRPHHYIRSILADGPVGRQGILKPGDELLQVNEYKLQGLKHIEVVKILKELPAQVKLVCARGPSAPSVINTSQNAEAFETRSLLPGGHQSLQNLLCKAQSESSLYTSSTATLTDQHRSKSVENVSGLALWSTDVTFIDIEKTEQGFGFSILDYQDPLDPEGSVIVIRGLIRGGSAETTNEIFPGDRLVSVGQHNLQSIELDEAVRILKGMPLGQTKLGICRPLSTSDSNIASPAPEEADRESPST